MQTWKLHKNPLVTVCCITYNQEKYIEDAIKGFLMQETDFPFEIIIHDDASTDNTVKILKKYAEQYPNTLQVIFQNENQYSQGHDVDSFIFEVAKGDYLAICEGDDYWTDPQKLQVQVSKMKEHPECHISFHAVHETMNDATESLNPNPRSKHHEKEKIFDPATVLAGGGSFMQTPSIMIHRDVLQNLPDFYYTAPATDYVLQFLGSLNGGALYINRVMGVYRVAADGSWRKSIEDEDKYIAFQTAWVDSYLNINRYYDRKYEKEIFSVLKTKAEYLAKFILLKKRDGKAFKKIIEIAYDITKYHSFEFLFWYYLRSLPSLLIFFSFILAFASRVKKTLKTKIRASLKG